MYQEDYLAHHGIKGMHWGVRRFQKPDGTRTSAGKARDKRTHKKRRGLTKNQKALLKTAGLAALGVGATAYALKTAGDAEKSYRRTADFYERTRSINDFPNEYYRQRADRARQAADEAREKYNAYSKANSSSRTQSGPNANSSSRTQSGPNANSSSRTQSGSNTNGSSRTQSRPNANQNRTNSGQSRTNANSSSRTQSGPNANSSSRTQSGPNANQNRTNSGQSRTNDRQRQARDTPRGANTSTRDDRKRREDQVKASGQKVDLGAARKRVQNLRDRVAKAQKDGTLTPDLIAELKDAQAQVRVAKQQNTAQHGAVWIINADDNYLMHHGIRGMKWGVRRFQTAGGSLTDAGRRRYANFVQNRQNRRAEKQQAKAARKQARSDKLNSVKERLTSDSAKAKYKKVAKGAAIAAGLAAAGYGTTLIAQGVRDQKNINKARDLANNIIANDKSFSKLGEAGKDKVRKELMSENLNRMADNRANKIVARKRMRSDFVQAVKDPTAGFDRSYIRDRAASGYYDFYQRKIISSNKDQWLKDNKDRLKDLGRKADDPEKYARKQEIKREKARKAAEEAMKKAAEERRAKAAESWANLGKSNR